MRKRLLILALLLLVPLVALGTTFNGVTLPGVIVNAGANLVTHSEAFRAAISGWTNTLATVTDDATTGPFGSSTADKIVLDGTAGSNHQVSLEIAKELFTDGASVTFSIHAKAGELAWVWLRVQTKSGAAPGAFFNLSTGAVGNEDVDAYDSEEVSDGWWRYWITHNISSGATDPRFFVYLAEGNGDIIIDGDGASGIYVLGAQVEEFPTVTFYRKKP